jgi:hypothetical protein
MEQHLVRTALTAPFRPPHDVVGMPPALCRDQLGADRAEPLLLVPEIALPPPSPLSGSHGRTQAALEVLLPSGIVRVGVLAPFDVACKGYAEGREKLDRQGAPAPRADQSTKYPPARPLRAEVRVPYPAGALVRMTPSGPRPYQLEDGGIDRGAGGFADQVPVLLRPAAQEAVELQDQVPPLGLFVRLHQFSGGVQKRLDALA